MPPVVITVKVKGVEPLGATGLTGNEQLAPEGLAAGSALEAAPLVREPGERTDA